MWRAWILSAFAAAVASLAAAEPAAASDPMPSSAPVTTAHTTDGSSTWSIFGFTICKDGASAAQHCDVRLPPLPQPPPQPTTPPKRLTLMGKTLCFGGTPHHPGCDWQLPQRDAHG